MRNITISIKQSDVFNDVQKLSSYEGAKKSTPEQNVYKNVLITEPQKEMLHPLFIECVNDIKIPVIKYMADFSVGDDGLLTITMHVPDNFDDAAENPIMSSMYAYLTNAVSSKWFVITLPGIAEYYASKAASAIKDVAMLINRRKRPDKFEFCTYNK